MHVHVLPQQVHAGILPQVPHIDLEKVQERRRRATGEAREAAQRAHGCSGR